MDSRLTPWLFSTFNAFMEYFTPAVAKP